MTAINSPAATEARVPEAVVTRVGGALVRYGLVVVIGWIGLLKRDRSRAVPGDHQLPVHDAGGRREVRRRVPTAVDTGQFLIKDVALLGIAVWTLADALRAGRVASHA
jgi:uncharacterized membrane protein YkgB